MSTCKISTGGQTAILKISSRGKCPSRIFNWGANVHLYFFHWGLGGGGGGANVLGAEGGGGGGGGKRPDVIQSKLCL